MVLHNLSGRYQVLDVVRAWRSEQNEYWLNRAE